MICDDCENKGSCNWIGATYCEKLKNATSEGSCEAEKIEEG